MHFYFVTTYFIQKPVPETEAKGKAIHHRNSLFKTLLCYHSSLNLALIYLMKSTRRGQAKPLANPKKGCN